jgi:hypothetical protein
MVLQLSSPFVRGLHCNSCKRHLPTRQKCSVVCTNDDLPDTSIGFKHWSEELLRNGAGITPQRREACVEFAFFQLLVGYEKLTIPYAMCNFPLLQLANNVLKHIPQTAVHFSDFNSRATFASTLSFQDVIGLMAATFTEDLKLDEASLNSKGVGMYSHFFGFSLLQPSSFTKYFSNPFVADDELKMLFPENRDATVRHLRNVCAHLNYEVKESDVKLTDSFYAILCEYLHEDLFSGAEGSRVWKRLAVRIRDFDQKTSTMFVRCNLTPYKLYCICRKFHVAVDAAAAL